MTWSQEVSLLFLDILNDPEIIRYLMRLAKPKHYQILCEEAREFHVSLRVTRDKRWLSTQELLRQGDFYKMNSYVPITCTLPFDNRMWIISQNILKMILYFKRNFIRSTYLINDKKSSYQEEMPIQNYPHPQARVRWEALTESSVIPTDLWFVEWDAPLPQKTKAVNLIFDHSSSGNKFRAGWGIGLINISLADLNSFNDDGFSSDHIDAPYLLIHSPITSFETKKIINNSIIPEPTYADFYIENISFYIENIINL
jgi:hypothetical protein